MDFLDKLILGKKTPKRGEHVYFPDKIYKRQSTNFDPWKFWGLFIVRNPISIEEAFLHISTLQDELRIPVWDKLCISTIYYSNILCIENIDNTIHRDENLLHLVLTNFKNNHEENIFNILRRIVDTNENINDLTLLVDFTYIIFNLPNATIENIDKILNEFFIRQDFRDMFSNQVDVKITTKFKELVYKNKKQLLKILDRFLVSDSTFYEILKGIYKSPKSKSDPIFDIAYVKKETYFDFLIVQNQNIKAQEIIKKEMLELKEENERLKKSLQ